MTFPEFFQSSQSGWTAFIATAAIRTSWLVRALKGNPMPQNVQTILADLDLALTFVVKRVPGATVDEKKAAVNAFINPRIQSALATAGASEFLTGLVVDAVDFAIDTEVALHFTAA
jgi:hypothetical protein